MFKAALFLFCIAAFGWPVPAAAQGAPVVAVVFSEPGFPAADSPAPSPAQLEKLFPGARFASAEQLGEALRDSATRLLVLPYGSAFPEAGWPDVFHFLDRGGNLLVLGGQPFSRAAFRDPTGWRLRDYSVRFLRPLQIDQYQITAGSQGLQFENNPDVLLKLPRFAWRRAFSPVIRLSAVDLYKRGGSAGSLDTRLDPLVWGVHDGRKLAAPALLIDHIRNAFTGGRWIFLNAELPPDFYDRPEASEIVRMLAGAAVLGAQEFIVRPVLPLYLPGEPVQVDIIWQPPDPPPANPRVRIITFQEQQPSARSVVTVNLPVTQAQILPPPSAKGFHIIEAELLEGSRPRALYRSGFWVREEAYLQSGPRLTVNHDYFELDGRPLAVVGATYMASDVQRLYFDHPNVFVWDRDLAHLRAAGLNMLRTGWWTGWDKLCDENGRPYERTLRTLEAFLLSARKHGLPVQFTFFAFLPEVLGGVNPYLDREAVRRQTTLVSAIVARFRDVPFLAWDFINEPSFSERLWTMRPNGDPIELAKWNEWLRKRYPDPAALAAAWNLPAASIPAMVPLPEKDEFAPRAAYLGTNSLKVYDFFLFAQESFAEWVRTMRDAVRATGSHQLVTVGQDEGGFVDRPTPAFFGPYVDFTTNHSWWLNDHLLWDSLVAKQPGIAMLMQETGIQRELTLEGIARRSPENEAALVERKFALSFAHGSGAIQWLWNANSYMTEGNETPIGAIRVDGTEKPEAAVMRGFAAFAKSLHQHLRGPQQPSVAIVTSQSAQFSVLADLQVEAQRKAVRASAYHARLTPYLIAENQIEKIGSPKLAILPSPQALGESAWQALLNYVHDGGNLLVTGPLDRDEHWRQASRAAALGLDARLDPLTYRNAILQLADRTVPLSFDQQKQTWLESLRFTDGATLKEIAHGKGRIFWAAEPVELAEGLEPAAALYAHVAARARLTSAFELLAPLSPGVLVYPLVLEDAVLYIFASDSAAGATVDLRDALTGVRLTLQLAAQHAALVLIGKQQKAVIASYGFSNVRPAPGQPPAAAPPAVKPKPIVLDTARKEVQYVGFQSHQLHLKTLELLKAH